MTRDNGQTLYLIRAAAWDEMAQVLAQRLQKAGARVVAIVDERRGAVACGDVEKRSIDEAALADLGFVDLPQDWGWFCGDLCYALAVDAFPDFANYALLESDVYVSQRAANDVVRLFDAPPAAALAAQLGPIDGEKKYSRGLSEFGLSASFGAIFPTTCVSADVARAMAQLRKEALNAQVRINDEGILVGAIQRLGASYGALETTAPALFAPESFDTNPPHLYEALVAREDEPSVHHPVVPLATVLARIESGEKRYHKHRLRKVIRASTGPQKALIRAALDQKAAGG